MGLPLLPYCLPMKQSARGSGCGRQPMADAEVNFRMAKVIFGMVELFEEGRIGCGSDPCYYIGA